MRTKIIIGCAIAVGVLLAIGVQIWSSSRKLPRDTIQVQAPARGGMGGRRGFAGGGPPGRMMGSDRGPGVAPDAFAELLGALGQVSLNTDFELTQGQKDKIQAIRDQARTARANWDKEHADELKKLAEQVRAVGRDGDPGQFRDLVQKRQDIMATAPNVDGAAAMLKAILTAEQLRALERYAAAKRASEAGPDELGGGMFGGGPGRGPGGGGGFGGGPGGRRGQSERPAGNPVAG